MTSISRSDGAQNMKRHIAKTTGNKGTHHQVPEVQAASESASKQLIKSGEPKKDPQKRINFTA